LKCKGNPHLEKVDDVNVICGTLKDFLRGLKEPLLTYHLHVPFTAAAGKHTLIQYTAPYCSVLQMTVSLAKQKMVFFAIA